MLSIWNPDITLEIPSGSFSESEQNIFLPTEQTEAPTLLYCDNRGGKNRYDEAQTFYRGRLAWRKYVVSWLFDEINLLIVNHCRSQIDWNPRKSLRYPFRETFLQSFISVPIVLTSWKYTGINTVCWKRVGFMITNKLCKRLSIVKVYCSFSVSLKPIYIVRVWGSIRRLEAR